jgi:uncharacterized protein (DUF302 family)
MADSLGFEVTLSLGFDTAVATTREALKVEGFGILTEIDLRAAFKEKLGKDFRPYLILGACHPPLAYSAVTADPAVGLLLPCNVTVESREAGAGQSTVRLTNPRALLAAAPGGLSAALSDVAADASRRMERVAAVLREHGKPGT